MPQITGPLTINDGTATPVAKSFAPQRVSPDLSVFTERSAPISAGYARLGVAYDPANSKRQTHPVDVSLDLPIVESVNGINVVTKKGLFKGYFVIPDTFTAQNRADLAAFVANALDVTAVRGVVKDLDPMY